MQIINKISFFAILVCLPFFSCQNTKSGSKSNDKNSIQDSAANVKLISENSVTINTSSDNSVNLDIQSIVQKSIDLPGLQPFYHIKELPERSPLVIAVNENVTANLELVKFGEPVVFIDKADAEKQNKAYIIFDELDVKENSATISFSYPAEGVHVHIDFIKTGNEWSINKSSIAES